MLASPLPIERVTDNAGFRACVELQRRIWGFSEEDLIPARYFNVVARVGGLLLAARDGEDYAGFCFGFPGRRGAEPIFYSHMTGVLPRWRGKGLALALKCSQRDFALDAGYGEICWTFDPLEARNAAFNLGKLGVVAEEYLVNVYGESSGPLHAGLDTDRFVARWLLESPRVLERLARPVPSRAEALEGFATALTSPDDVRTGVQADQVVVALPEDIQAIKREDMALARRWRSATRAVLSDLFGRGYRLVDFLRAPATGGWLLLERGRS